MTVVPISKERASKIRKLDFGWGENLTDEEIIKVYVGSDKEFKNIIKTYSLALKSEVE